MQRIIGTLKFQGLVLGAKFVLTAPCPVEEARVRGRLFLAKQSKLHSKQKYFRLSATNRSPGKLFTALWNEEVSKERYSTTYFLIFQRLHGLTSAVCQIAGHLEACCACKGDMENWVLVFCAPLLHHREVLLQGSVCPTACNQCMSTTRQGTCEASHWSLCHRWRATCMLLLELSSLTLFIWVHGLLVALDRSKDNFHEKAMNRM